MIEFAPDDTPRCVEKPGVASFPLAWGHSLLQTVYGSLRPSTQDRGGLNSASILNAVGGGKIIH